MSEQTPTDADVRRKFPRYSELYDEWIADKKEFDTTKLWDEIWDLEKAIAALTAERDYWRKRFHEDETEAINILKAELVALKQRAQEPTFDMCMAGMNAWNNTFGTPITRYAAIYKAMLSEQEKVLENAVAK